MNKRQRILKTIFISLTALAVSLIPNLLTGILAANRVIASVSWNL